MGKECIIYREFNCSEIKYEYFENPKRYYLLGFVHDTRRIIAILEDIRTHLLKEEDISNIKIID